jgi:GAF domain-containing protein/HAMP domain-containing protein
VSNQTALESISARLRGISIRRLLQVGSLLVISLVVFAGAILIWQVNVLNNAVSTFQSASTLARSAEDVELLSTSLIAEINRLLPLEDSELFVTEIEQIVVDLDESNNELAALALGLPVESEGAIRLTRISDSLASVINTAQTMVRQADAGQWASVQVRVGILTQGQQQLSVETSELVDFTTAAESEASSQVDSASRAAVIFPTVMVLVAIGLLLVVRRRVVQAIAVPIEVLTAGVEEFTHGNLGFQIEEGLAGEMGQLAGAFNQMASEVKVSQEDLERQVAERTTQLQASFTVGQSASSILEPTDLINQVVNLITDQFGYYYAAIFLIDDAGKWAVLQDATGEAGQALLERHHRLEIGGQSMVGSAVSMRQARVALDVGDEPVRFDNPFLPDTRSEIALPLISADRVLGALDVQSVEPSAFGVESIDTLQNMATQVAIALSNAHLYQESQGQIRELDNLYQASQTLISVGQRDEVFKIVSNQMLEASAMHGCTIMSWNREANAAVVEFDYSLVDGENLDDKGTQYDLDEFPITGQVIREGRTLASRWDRTQFSPSEQEYVREYNIKTMLNIPLIVQGRVIGEVELQDVEQTRELSPSQIRLIEALANQTATIMENLRVLEESQRLARRERVINEITEKIHRQIDVESIMKTALGEIAELLQVDEATIRLGTEEQLIGARPVQPEQVTNGTRP